jgi:hypothetical protein
LKNLGKTIEKIIKVDPALEERLTPIKNKWKRYPSKTMNYWKELIDFLNSNPLLEHPKRGEIRNIVAPKKKPIRQHLNSFEPALPSDRIIGIVPENIADIIRRHDRQTIDISKMHLEANMTRNVGMAAEVSRKETLLDITSKKIWLALKDHYQLWTKPSVFNIKIHNNVLVVVEQTQPSIPPAFVGPGLVKMDPTTMKQFLQFLGSIGMEPPSQPDEDK